MSDIVIGIDLGTTNSCAAYYYDDDLRILENAEGGRTTPSIVIFTKTRIPFVGPIAKKQSLIYPECAVAEIKRIIGRQKNDPYVQDNLKYFPFELDPDFEEPKILIKQKDGILRKTPSNISAAILLKIKQDVESKLGQNIKKAVITVPAYFNVNQKEATLEAAKEAGFEVLKLLNEPTAAALSYYHNKKCDTVSDDQEHYALVYDLGGGTFDVAIIRKRGANIEVISVDGDSHLGGHDFDQKIFDFVCNKGNKLHRIQDDKRKTRRFLNLCEDAKKDLSTPNLIQTEIAFSQENLDDETQVTLTKKQFEEIIQPYIKKTIQIVDNCLKTAKLSKKDIAEIILAGGSTRIPKVRESLSSFFGGKQLNKNVNPDECVAEGAALQAALLSKSKNQRIQFMQISEVTPSSLGIMGFCDKMSVIISRNTKLPTTKSVSYVNTFDQQTTMVFQIYEGERLNAKKNNYLGVLTIDNLTPASPKECEVKLKMSIDNNGILKVTAQEKYKTNVKDLTITYARIGNNEKGIKHEVQSNEKYEEEDKKFEEFTIRKTYLYDYCVSFCNNIKDKNIESKHRDLYRLCENTQKEVIKMGFENERQIQEMIKNVTKNCDSVVASNNFKRMPTAPVQVLNKSLKSLQLQQRKSISARQKK